MYTYLYVFKLSLSMNFSRCRSTFRVLERSRLHCGSLNWSKERHPVLPASLHPPSTQHATCLYARWNPMMPPGLTFCSPLVASAPISSSASVLNVTLNGFAPAREKKEEAGSFIKTRGGDRQGFTSKCFPEARFWPVNPYWPKNWLFRWGNGKPYYRVS